MPKELLPKLLVLVGPTASGKTILAIKTAKKFNGEIISADSRQIYRGMDIGTAKPSKSERENIEHYLIGIKNPNESYTVAQYKKDCLKAIKEMLTKNKLPILVGGTGLYVASITENLEFPRVKPNPRLRKRLERDLQIAGLRALYQHLIQLDPEAAYIVDPKNPRRIIRALEVTLVARQPFSKQRKREEKLFDILKIGIAPPKDKLKRAIENRVDLMIKKGLIAEVKKLIGKYPATGPVFDAIGYREIINYLEKKSSLEEAVSLIKNNTWRYARRQITWFKKDKEIIWIDDPRKASPIIRDFLSLGVSSSPDLSKT